MSNSNSNSTTLMKRTPRTPGGRTRWEITAAGLAAVCRMKAEGNADATVAKTLGIGKTVFRDLRDRDPRIDEAMQVGNAELADELTDILLTHARGGSITAAIYLSKARLGWRDQGASPAGTQATQVNISIPAPMSDAEFKKMVTVQTVKAPTDG